MQSTPRIAHDTGKPTKFSLSDLDGTHWLRSDMMEVHVRGDEACIGKQKSKLKVSKDTMTCEGYELTHSTDIRLKWVHPEGHVIYWHKDGAEAPMDLQAALDKISDRLSSELRALGTMWQQALETTLKQNEALDRIVKTLDQTVLATPIAYPEIRTPGAVKEEGESPIRSRHFFTPGPEGRLASVPEAEEYNGHLLSDKMETGAARRSMQLEGHDDRDAEDPSNMAAHASPSLDSPQTIMQQMRLLSVVKFRDLDDEVLLRDHISRIEAQLVKVGLTRKGAILEHLQDDVCNKFLESLRGVPSCSNAAKAITNEYGSNWAVLKAELIRRVASKESLRMAFDKRIAALNFASITKADAYIDQGAAIYQLICKVYGQNENSRVRDLVNRFIMNIPYDNVRRDIMDRMVQRGIKHPDWELTVPFMNVYRPNQLGIIDLEIETPSVCGIVKEVCLLYRRSFISTDKKPPVVKPQTGGSFRDNLNLIAETERMEPADDDKRWVITGMDWAARDTVTTKLKDLGFQKISAKQMADGRVFVFVVSDRPTEDVANLIKPTGLSVRKFQGKRSGDSRRPISKTNGSKN